MKVFIRMSLVLALAAGLCAQQPAKSATSQPAQKDSGGDQQRTVESFYRLALSLYELDGSKRTNQRDYVMMGKTNYHPSVIHIGTRVPIYTEEKKVQYVDAGLDIQCDLKEQGARMQADCNVTISNFIPPEQLAGGGNTVTTAPVLRSTRTSSYALLTLGKPAVIATVDDVNSARRMQIEVTATRVD